MVISACKAYASKAWRTNLVGLAHFFYLYESAHTKQVVALPPFGEDRPSVAWAFDGAGQHFSSPTSIQSMAGFQGYGASKFKPLLTALNQKKWLHAYEDRDFVYVQLQQSENFYQLPVKIKDVRKVTGGVEATADVFSDEARQNLLLQNLRVVANQGSRIATRLSNHEDIKFLLGVFSVNLRKAMDVAKSHATEQDAVFSPSSLEFFAYGVPLEHAVSSSKCVNDKEADE